MRSSIDADCNLLKKLGKRLRVKWRLAPLKVTPSGVPRASILRHAQDRLTRWRLVPGLPLSVGFGPVAAPPFSQPRWRCRARLATSPVARRRGGAPAALGAALPTRPRAAGRASAASSSCPSRSPSPAAGTPMAAPCVSHEQDAGQCRTVRDRRPPAFWAKPRRRQQRLEHRPQVVRYKGLRHDPETHQAAFC